MVFTPSQTELNVDGDKPADGQTELLDDKAKKQSDKAEVKK